MHGVIPSHMDPIRGSEPVADVVGAEIASTFPD